MPIQLLDQPTAGAAPRSGGIRLLDEEPTSAPEPSTESSGGSGLSLGVGALAGTAALAGAAYLSHNSNTPSLLKKILDYGNAARQQLMLSGLAPVKSFLGNIGAAAAESAESRSLTPLKSYLSMDTVRDAIDAYKNGESAQAALPGMETVRSGVNLPGPMPGRIMGALDSAAQKAMIRAGLSPADAERVMMQAPLGDVGKAFEDNPIAQFLVPFRRTPFNQFTEGLKVMGSQRDLPVLAGYMGTGAAHGYATADDKYPVSVPLAVAASAKYGVPYGIGAIAGRVLAGKKDAGNASAGITPISEYGITQSISEPLAPFGVKIHDANGEFDPSFSPDNFASIKALKQLVGR